MEELMNIADLKPSSRSVNAEFHVIEKGDAKEVVSRKDGSTYRVAEALVGDATGSVLMSVWNDDIELIEEGENYRLSNGYINVFKNSMRLNVGRNGQIEKIDKDIEPNKEVNISVRRVESRFKPRRGYKKGSGKRY